MKRKFLCLMALFVLISQVTIGLTAPAAGKIYQAEEGQLTGTVIEQKTPGYSGSGYVTSFDNAGDAVEITVNEPAGIYNLSIGYAAPWKDKVNDLYVNGSLYDHVSFPQSAAFKEISVGELPLNHGVNTIKLQHNWGWFLVDYIKLEPVTKTETGQLSATPVLSRGLPAFATAGPAANANDFKYDTTWRAAVPCSLAYDLSAVPAEQRQELLVVWYNNDTYDYDHTLKNRETHNLPQTYTIEGNDAPGNGAVPTQGWVQLLSVADNDYHSRQHVIDFAGYNWLRMVITKASRDNASINLDVYSAPSAIQDDWIFLGDSITAGGMALSGKGKGTFAQIINQAKPEYFPVAEGGGSGATTSAHLAQKIDEYLKIFPGKYVGLAYGTNDCWDKPDGAGRFYQNMEYAVKAILAAGKVPVVAKIPWARLAAVQNNAPLYNAKIDALYQAYPQIIKGPDLWGFFQKNPDLINGGTDNVHPSAEGYNALREQWAQTMLDEVYHKDLIYGRLNIPWDWVGVIGTGQSLAVGSKGKPVQTKTQPYNNLKLSLGNASGWPLDPNDQALAMVPLVEPVGQLATDYPSSYPNNISGETAHSAMANQVTALVRSLAGRDYIGVHGEVGESGQPLSRLCKGATPDNTVTGRSYEAALFQTEAMTRLAKAAGKTYGIGAIIVTHGEADAGNTNYEAALLKLWSDYNADLPALTGQTQKIQMILSQQHASPKSKDSRSASTLAQWQIGVNHPEMIVCSGPKYQYPYDQNDHTHLVAEGYRLLGEKYGQVYYERVVRGNNWQPLQPTAVKRNGQIITVQFHVPVPPLVWDNLLPRPHQSAAPEWKEGKGFEVRNAKGRVKINGVKIVGNAVEITCDADPGPGTVVGYAMTTDGTAMTTPFYGTIRWGQLRDSDPFVGYSTQKPQPNYCVAFELIVP